MVYLFVYKNIVTVISQTIRPYLAAKARNRRGISRLISNDAIPLHFQSEAKMLPGYKTRQAERVASLW